MTDARDALETYANELLEEGDGWYIDRDYYAPRAFVALRSLLYLAEELETSGQESWSEGGIGAGFAKSRAATDIRRAIREALSDE